MKSALLGRALVTAGAVGGIAAMYIPRQQATSQENFYGNYYRLTSPDTSDLPTVDWWWFRTESAVLLCLFLSVLLLNQLIRSPPGRPALSLLTFACSFAAVIYVVVCDAIVGLGPVDTFRRLASASVIYLFLVLELAGAAIVVARAHRSPP